MENKRPYWKEMLSTAALLYKEKHYWKEIVAISVLLLLVFSGAFFGINLGYRLGIEQHMRRMYRGKTSKPRVSKPQKPYFYAAPQQGASEVSRKEDVTYPFTFVVYGDSSEPAGHEKDLLIDQIIEEKPNFVIHLGNSVLYSGKHQWKIFDQFEGRILKNGIPLFPVLGNQEYATRKGPFIEAEELELNHYFDRFTLLEGKRWYSFKYGNSTFVILDTNVNYYGGSFQYNWLIRRLKDTSSSFLFAAFHHPVYTKNSRYSARESEKFLADIFENYGERKLVKTDIIFSGHARNYERYKKEGINYIVSGGGGALQAPVGREPSDIYNKPGPTFHFCRVTVHLSKAIFEMLKWDDIADEWVQADSFTIFK